MGIRRGPWNYCSRYLSQLNLEYYLKSLQGTILPMILGSLHTELGFLLHSCFCLPSVFTPEGRNWGLFPLTPLFFFLLSFSYFLTIYKILSLDRFCLYFDNHQTYTDLWIKSGVWRICMGMEWWGITITLKRIMQKSFYKSERGRRNRRRWKKKEKEEKE